METEQRGFAVKSAGLAPAAPGHGRADGRIHAMEGARLTLRPAKVPGERST